MPASWFTEGTFSLCFHTKASPPLPGHLPKASRPNTITAGARISTGELGAQMQILGTWHGGPRDGYELYLLINRHFLNYQGRRRKFCMATSCPALLSLGSCCWLPHFSGQHGRCVWAGPGPDPPGSVAVMGTELWAGGMFVE